MSSRTEKYVTEERFQKVMEHFWERLTALQIEVAAFQEALTSAGILTEEQLNQARKGLLERLKQGSDEQTELFRKAGPIDPTKKSS